MKITSFGPEVLVTDAEPVIELFKDMGFEPRHHQEGMTEENVTGNVLRDANGFIEAPGAFVADTGSAKSI